MKTTILVMVAALTLTACASTAQLESVNQKADIAIAQSNASLTQSEAALMASELNAEKIDRMYVKLMGK